MGIGTRLLILGLLGALVALPAVAGAADPPGNNGTVKIDDVPFDTHPDNEPHVGCDFEVDFYGFDLGDYNATVTFQVWPPTGDREVLLQDSVFIGEDAAGGGTDLDAEREYNLSDELAAFAAHPKQGHHVKLTVNAPGSIGADTKHKVFWVLDCQPPPPGEANLVIHKNDTPDPVVAGANLVYRISVTNRGPDSATNVTLIDPLPANVVFVSATPTQGTCGFDAQTVTCSLGALAPGGNAKVRIVVTTTEPGTLSNTATVRADQVDPSPANRDTELTTVI